MSGAESLRAAAARLRTVREFQSCQCDDHGDTWFDRTICPEPCGQMHTVCNRCGRPLGYCAFSVEAGKPSLIDLALANWLDNAAEDYEMQIPGGPLEDRWDIRVQISTKCALAVADLIVADEDDHQ